MVIASATPRLYPADGPSPAALKAGFRFGAKGTHTSRTIMLDELSTLLAATAASATRDDYATAIIGMNCLAKPTASSRRLTNQRIGELYALDFAVPLFRVFRRLWDIDKPGHQLLAMLCAIARDPLLAATVPAILMIPPGGDLSRDLMAEAVRISVGERLNVSTIAKVVRNAASSWTQSGHFTGRTFKKRNLVSATAASVALAIYLGHAVGFRGAELFSSAWVAVLDCSHVLARQLAVEAKRLGLIDLRISGDVVELNLDRLDPAGARS
jgi:hypothetical protein